MQNYALFTDTGCDISPKLLNEWQVECVDLRFRRDGETAEYVQAQMPTPEFYREMREGAVFKTSAANEDDFTNAFTPVLEGGTDILYIAFSSGLSSTAGAAVKAAQTLAERFPERRVEVVSSLAASAGQGLLVRYAVQNFKNGLSLDENAADIREKVPHMCHWFTVDDLKYLKRGGRVSTASALLGTALNIKPVLHVDDDGHLIPVHKVIGRRMSLNTMLAKMKELAMEDKPVYFISHGDCIDDAKLLEEKITEEFGVTAALITDIGPVIGAHSGPGTLAVFFLGIHK